MYILLLACFSLLNHSSFGFGYSELDYSFLSDFGIEKKVLSKQDIESVNKALENAKVNFQSRNFENEKQNSSKQDEQKYNQQEQQPTNSSSTENHTKQNNKNVVVERFLANQKTSELKFSNNLPPKEKIETFLNIQDLDSKLDQLLIQPKYKNNNITFIYPTLPVCINNSFYNNTYGNRKVRLVDYYKRKIASNLEMLEKVLQIWDSNKNAILHDNEKQIFDDIAVCTLFDIYDIVLPDIKEENTKIYIGNKYLSVNDLNNFLPFFKTFILNFHQKDMTLDKMENLFNEHYKDKSTESDEFKNVKELFNSLCYNKISNFNSLEVNSSEKPHSQQAENSNINENSFVNIEPSNNTVINNDDDTKENVSSSSQQRENSSFNNPTQPANINAYVDYNNTENLNSSSFGSSNNENSYVNNTKQHNNDYNTQPGNVPINLTSNNTNSDFHEDEEAGNLNSSKEESEQRPYDLTKQYSSAKANLILKFSDNEANENNKDFLNYTENAHRYILSNLIQNLTNFKSKQKVINYYHDTFGIMENGRGIFSHRNVKYEAEKNPFATIKINDEETKVLMTEQQLKDYFLKKIANNSEMLQKILKTWNSDKYKSWNNVEEKTFNDFIVCGYYYIYELLLTKDISQEDKENIEINIQYDDNYTKTFSFNDLNQFFPFFKTFLINFHQKDMTKEKMLELFNNHYTNELKSKMTNDQVNKVEDLFNMLSYQKQDILELTYDQDEAIDLLQFGNNEEVQKKGEELLKKSKPYRFGVGTMDQELNYLLLEKLIVPENSLKYEKRKYNALNAEYYYLPKIKFTINRQEVKIYLTEEILKNYYKTKISNNLELQEKILETWNSDQNKNLNDENKEKLFDDLTVCAYYNIYKKLLTQYIPKEDKENIEINIEYENGDIKTYSFNELNQFFPFFRTFLLNFHKEDMKLEKMLELFNEHYTNQLISKMTNDQFKKVQDLFNMLFADKKNHLTSNIEQAQNTSQETNTDNFSLTDNQQSNQQIRTYSNAEIRNILRFSETTISPERIEAFLNFKHEESKDITRTLDYLLWIKLIRPQNSLHLQERQYFDENKQENKFGYMPQQPFAIIRINGKQIDIYNNKEELLDYYKTKISNNSEMLEKMLSSLAENNFTPDERVFNELTICAYYNIYKCLLTENFEESNNDITIQIKDQYGNFTNFSYNSLEQFLPFFHIFLLNFQNKDISSNKIQTLFTEYYTPLQLTETELMHINYLLQKLLMLN